ncbi:thermostable hemolysin [Sphingomonas sp. CD22]|uniref:thermostable hemolysin n=1 Tax=Sphingomonas sp. CD22 TaxID=3100214 RepID=UPI002ADFDB71|nr:thermostable hemolysin [Sphingomonas sp. CD22]MEA1086347.1 thermostable hemolysin [Sphingomonas sp. CD22]
MSHAAIRTLIQSRYVAVHDARPAVEFPAYLTVGAPDMPQAVLGYRPAGADALFVERYVDGPIERLLSERLGRPVPRSRIVEIGAHASHRATATLALWREAAAALDGQADVAVAVLTRGLRSMFARLDLPILILAPAPMAAMGAAADRWGRYYDSDPMLCAGDIAQSHIRLARAMTRQA